MRRPARSPAPLTMRPSDGHRRRFHHQPYRDGELVGCVDEFLPERPWRVDDRSLGNFASHRRGRAEHQFLSVARQFAIDGNPGDASRHHHARQQHVGPGRLRIRLPRSNPAGDSLGNPGGEDNYALARNLGLTLRIDNLATATANLMTTAQTTEAANSAKYQWRSIPSIRRQHRRRNDRESDDRGLGSIHHRRRRGL